MMLPRRRRIAVPTHWSAPVVGFSDRARTGDLLTQGYAPSQLIEDLRKYQAELEIQNQALRYSQEAAEGASERFATLFSHVPLALMVVDEEGLVMASNAMALRLFQPLESDPPLHFLLPFVESSHTDEVAVAFLSAKSAGTSEVHEVVFKAGLHDHFTGDLHIARIENPMGELAHFICAFVDQGPLLAQRQALQKSATVLQQRNEDLHASESRMAAIINSSLDAILCVDAEQRITVFNPAASALFECSVKDALGSPLSRFLPAVAQAMHEGRLQAQTLLGEFAATTQKGHAIQVEISVSLERRRRARAPHDTNHEPGPALRGRVASSNEVTTIFARDLTAAKAATAQRETLQAQLRESQKMQAMGTLAGGIAHDFNNILSAILGNVELARHDLPDESPAQTSLQEIDKAGRRARDLVRQILTFSRNEAAVRSPLHLDELVQEAARLVRVTLPPAIKLQVHVTPGTPTVLANATQVEQALVNLCTNAVLAMGGRKGSVHMTLTAATLDSPVCDRLGVRAGPYVAVRVQDSGAGMSAQTLARIFEPFFTTREVGQGTGLGLSVVHGIMQTHQGAIDVDSELGQGSTFTLYFPATDNTPATPAPEPLPTPVIKGAGRHVLYVDDDEALVFLIARVMRRKGFTVTTFTDPQQALEAVQAHPQSFDVLVTDYNMPGYSGLDLLRQVRQLRADLPVALASGYITPELEQQALLEGARALIYKPNDVGEFCETVQRLIDGGDAA
ncbi:MAG: response regulator [Rhodoferax sp.]